jgi:hypothetical protein
MCCCRSRCGEKRQQLPKDCEEIRSKHIKLFQSATRVRVIGIESMDGFEDFELPIFSGNKELKKVDRFWWLSRVITDKGCLHLKDCEDLNLFEKDRYLDIYE